MNKEGDIPTSPPLVLPLFLGSLAIESLGPSYTTCGAPTLFLLHAWEGNRSPPPTPSSCSIREFASHELSTGHG